MTIITGTIVTATTITAAERTGPGQMVSGMFPLPPKSAFFPGFLPYVLGACLGTALLLFLCGKGFAQGAITWMEVNMPPFMIQTGPDQHQGYGDTIAAILREHLPQYRHEIMVTNVTRHFDRFKKGENICIVGLFRTPEREQFMHFSIPSMMVLPPVLIVLKDRLHEFGDQGAVSLETVLSSPDTILVHSRDRSYGQSIDNLFKKYPRRHHSILFSGQELTANYFQMLAMRRVDALVALPEEAMYQAEKLGMGDRIATVALVENQQDSSSWLCSVGCTKNAWGKEVIDQINRVLLRERSSQRYRAAYERWLDANAMTRYRRIYDRVFLAIQP